MNNQRVAKLLILLLCLQINDITFCSDEGDFTFNTKADESHKAATKQDTENEKDTAIYAVERQNAQNNAKKMTAATNADKQSVADQSNVASKETITLSNDIVAKDTQSSGSIEKNVEKQAAIEARRARDTKKTLGDMFNEGLSRVQVRASDITKKIPDSVKKIFNDIFASSDLKAELQDIKERDVSEVEKQNLERAARLEDKIKRIKRKNISEKDKKNFEQNIRAVAEDRVAELQKFKEDITKAENNLEKAKKALMTDTAKYQVTNSDGKMVKKTYKEIVDKVQSIKDTKNYYKNHKLSKELAVLSLKVSEIENKKKFTVGQKPNTKEETLSGLEKATKDIKHEHQVALQKLANQERAILIQAGGTSWANTIMDWLGKAKDLITKKTGGENKSVVTSGQNSLAESSDVVTQNSDKDLSKTILSTENKSSTNDANLDQQADSTSKTTVTSVDNEKSSSDTSLDSQSKTTNEDELEMSSEEQKQVARNIKSWTDDELNAQIRTKVEDVSIVKALKLTQEQRQAVEKIIFEKFKAIRFKLNDKIDLWRAVRDVTNQLETDQNTLEQTLQLTSDQKNEVKKYKDILKRNKRLKIGAAVVLFIVFINILQRLK